MVLDNMDRIREAHRVCKTWVDLLKQAEMGEEIGVFEESTAPEQSQEDAPYSGNPLETIVELIIEIRARSEKLQRELARACDALMAQRVKRENDTVTEVKKALENQKAVMQKSWDVNMHHMHEQWKDEHIHDARKREQEAVRLQHMSDNLMRINRESAQSVAELEAQNTLLLQEAIVETRKRVETEQVLRASMDALRTELEEV